MDADPLSCDSFIHFATYAANTYVHTDMVFAFTYITTTPREPLSV